VRHRGLTLLVSMGLVVACGGDGGSGDAPVSSYRVTIESIFADDVEAADLDTAPRTLDIDASVDRGRGRGIASSAVACPEDESTEESGSPDDTVELEIVLTTRVLYVRTAGCGPDADVWQQSPSGQLIFLLTPARLDLDDPKAALERRFGAVFDEDLSAVYPTDCARLGRPFCDSLRMSGGDPLLFVEAGVEQLIFDVDLDESGRIASMVQRWTDDEGEPRPINGLIGQRFHITDYGIPVEIEVPDVPEGPSSS